MPKWTYYPDYDSQNGVRLSTAAEKISYLEGRTEKILLNPLREVLRLRKQNQSIWDLNICVATLICEGISGLSIYTATGKERGKPFMRFVRDFLYPKDVRKKAFSKVLWDNVRCSLCHGLYIEGGWIETAASKHFMVGPGGKLILDLESFFNDFEVGAKRFFRELKASRSRQMISIFESRFNKIFSLLI